MKITIVPLSNNDMIRYIINLIRYDIPILMAGKSSIGKSFTILKLAEQWGMPNSVLYVGSEKADNIEGLPKLIDPKAEEKENVLTYYKPYWFPTQRLIQNAVKRGYDVFNQKIRPNFASPDFNNLPYSVVMGLLYALRPQKFLSNETSATFDLVDKSGFIVEGDNKICNGNVTLTRELVPLDAESSLGYQNELHDLCLFLCTLAGLGNYWLILDELDKVQQEEADKFAPMLHIVRERRLKVYNMREFNEGRGADVANNVVKGSYVPIYNMIEDALMNDKSVLDTRIISISNKTDNIIDISDALFKRFVQVVIGDILVLDQVESKLSEIRQCLSAIETKIGGSQGDLTVGKLEEINLQWQFGFLPRILNNNDIEGNFIRKNYLEKVLPALNMPDENARKQRINELGKLTALYKLCVDNFTEEVTIKDIDGNKQSIPDLVMDCLKEQFSSLKQAEQVETRNPMDIIKEFQKKGFDDKDTALAVYDFLMDKYKLIPSGESRYIEMENLIRYAFDFIRYTAYADGYDDSKIANAVEYNPLSINAYLIPLMIKFTLKIATKDEIISFDDRDRLLSAHAQLWSNFAIPEHMDKIKGDPDLTQQLFYGGDDSLWGSADLNADDFQNSFVNKFNTANIELFEDFIKEYVSDNMTDAKRDEFTDFIEYIKKYRLDDVKQIMNRQVDVLKKTGKSSDVVNLKKKYIKLFGKEVGEK